MCKSYLLFMYIISPKYVFSLLYYSFDYLIFEIRISWRIKNQTCRKRKSKIKQKQKYGGPEIWDLRSSLWNITSHVDGSFCSARKPWRIPLRSSPGGTPRTVTDLLLQSSRSWFMMKLIVSNVQKA